MEPRQAAAGRPPPGFSPRTGRRSVTTVSRIPETASPILIQSAVVRSARDEAFHRAVLPIEDAERDIGRAEQVARRHAHALQQPVGSRCEASSSPILISARKRALAVLRSSAFSESLSVSSRKCS